MARSIHEHDTLQNTPLPDTLIRKRVCRFSLACWRWLAGFISEVWNRAMADRLQLPAGSVAFFLLLSLIPLLLLLVTIGSYFLVGTDSNQIQSRIFELTGNLSPSVHDMLVEQLQGLVDSRTILTGVALLVGFWTGSQVFVIMEMAMNQVWHSPRRRPIWISRPLAVGMVLFTGVVMLIAAGMINTLRVLSHLNIPFWNQRIENVPCLVMLINFLISGLVPFLLTTLLFGIIYRVMPTRRVTWHSALPGAAFAALLWVIFMHIFGFYINLVSRGTNAVFFTSLGGVILLLLLFYYSAWIMLVGAEISAVFHRRLMQAGDEEEQRAEVTEIAESER